MSVYFEYLMHLWQNDSPEFLNQAAKLLTQEVLSPEETDRVLDLFLRSLPPEVLAKLLEDESDKAVFQASHS